MFHSQESLLKEPLLTTEPKLCNTALPIITLSTYFRNEKIFPKASHIFFNSVTAQGPGFKPRIIIYTLKDYLYN